MEKPDQYIEKRVFARTLAMFECHCFNIEYFGLVTDLSEKGMFIRSQKIILPLESRFDVCIPSEEGEMFPVRVEVKRLEKSNSFYDGIGVEVLNPPQEYLDLVSSLKSS
jgi:hypothetical protein